MHASELPIWRDTGTVFACRTYESDPVEAMKQLQELAEVKNVNDAVRLGDIYAVLIIHNVKKENYKKVWNTEKVQAGCQTSFWFQAQTYFEELRKRMPKLDVHRHLKPQVIERIYKQLNLPVPKMKGGVGDQQNGGGDDYIPEASSLKRKLETSENGVITNANDG